MCLLAPIPSSVYADGVVCAENDTVIRAKRPGFLRSIHAQRGQTVHAGEPVVELENDHYRQSLAQRQSDLKASDLLRDAYRVLDPVKGLEEEARRVALEKALADARDDVNQLTPRFMVEGRVVGAIDAAQTGRFVRAGDPLALVEAGPCMVRALVPEVQLVRMTVREGDAVVFRASTAPGQDLEGTIIQIAPAGSRTVGFASLTQLGGGDTVVDPRTLESDKPHFEVLIRLEPGAAQFARYGASGTVRIPARSETVGRGLTRRILRFWNQLYQ